VKAVVLMMPSPSERLDSGFCPEGLLSWALREREDKIRTDNSEEEAVGLREMVPLQSSSTFKFTSRAVEL
jgi:hypothetical protein